MSKNIVIMTETRRETVQLEMQNIGIIRSSVVTTLLADVAGKGAMAIRSFHDEPGDLEDR